LYLLGFIARAASCYLPSNAMKSPAYLM